MYETDDEQVSAIYMTKDYQKFKLNGYNRRLQLTRIESLKRQFKVNENVPPIEVFPENGKLVIIDGQHRFSALMALKKSIPYYLTYLNDYKTTQGLRARNKGRAWGTIDTINSFAENPNNSEAVRQQYSNLAELVSTVRSKLGRIPVISIIETSQGIDRALDQPLFNEKETCWSNGKYKMIDLESYLEIIDRLKEIQTNTAQFSMKAAVFQALFALCSDNDINIEYFTYMINNNRAQFETILVSNNAADVLEQLLSFYNSQVLFKPEYNAKTIASAKGVSHHIVMQGSNFRNNLFLK